MAGECDCNDGKKFDRQPQSRPCLCSASISELQPESQPNQEACDGGEDQVQEKNALKGLAFELEAPCKQARGDGGERRNCGSHKVVVSRFR